MEGTKKVVLRILTNILHYRGGKGWDDMYDSARAEYTDTREAKDVPHALGMNLEGRMG